MIFRSRQNLRGRRTFGSHWAIRNVLALKNMLVDDLIIGKLLYLLNQMNDTINFIHDSIGTIGSWWDDVINNHLRQVQMGVKHSNLLEAVIKAFTIKATVRTYVFHMSRTYVMILCNWLIL